MWQLITEPGAAAAGGEGAGAGAAAAIADSTEIRQQTPLTVKGRAKDVLSNIPTYYYIYYIHIFFYLFSNILKIIFKLPIGKISLIH